nr:FecR family protein [Fusibacter paucivorans]
MTLEHGDRIITGKNSSISLKIDEDKYIKVGEKTYMSLSELMEDAESGTSTNIKLFTGQVWASLTKPLGSSETFEIETPTAVMGAKGTKFMVKYVIEKNDDDDNYDGTTELVVLEGTVSMKTEVQHPGTGEGAGEDTGEGTGEGTGTQVPADGRQEVEIMVHQNQEIKVNAKLMQRVAEEIERVINEGAKIEEINIQEVVEKSAAVENVKVENLDLFVLEIIEEDPEEYGDELTDKLPDVIKQKQQEAQDQDDEEDAPIDGSGIIYDDDKDDDAPSGGNTSTGSDDDTTVTQVRLYSANTVDADKDGIVDYVALYFNIAVDDSSFDGTVAKALSSNVLGTLAGSTLADMTHTDVVDTADDNIVYLALNPKSETANTAATDTLNINGAGMIDALNGTILNAQSITVTDGAAPRIQKVVANLNGDASDSMLVITMSEKLNEAGLPDILEHIQLTTGGAYSIKELETVDWSKTAIDQVENTVTIKPLPKAVKSALANMAADTVYFDSVIISDDGGNTTDIGNAAIQIDQVTQDTAPAYIQSVSAVEVPYENGAEFFGALALEETTPPVYQETVYHVTLSLSDYLSDSSVAVAMDLASWIDGSGVNGGCYPENMVYNDEDPAAITLSFDLAFYGLSPMTGDQIKLSLQSLDDLTGTPLRFGSETSYDNAFDLIFGENSTFEAKAPSDEVAYVEIEKIMTRDEDADGFVDLLEIKFTEAVDDLSYSGTDTTLYLDGTVGTLSSASLYKAGSGSFADTANDNVIFIKVNESTETYNTQLTDKCYFGDAVIKALSGKALKAYPDGFAVMDGAPPQIVGVSAFLDGDAQDKHLVVLLSEPVTKTDAKTFFANASIGTTSYGTYETGIAFDANTVASITETGNAYDITHLNTAVIEALANGGVYLYLKDGLTVYDALGNYMAVDGVYTVNTMSADMAPTSVAVDKITYLDGYYHVTLTLSDLIDQSLLSDYKASEDIIDGDMMYAPYLSDVRYSDMSSAALSLTYDLSIYGEGLYSGSAFTIDLTGLKDMHGRPLYYAYDDKAQTSIRFVYQDGTFVEAPPISFALQRVETCDINADGYIDHLKFIFNKDVKDISYAGESRISMTNQSIGSLDTGSIANVLGDETDDEVIYLTVSNLDGINTDASGMLDIAAGMINSIDGDVLSGYSDGFVISDGVAPIFTGFDVSFGQGVADSFVELTFSEPVTAIGTDAPTAKNLFENYVGIGTQTTTDYASSMNPTWNAVTFSENMDKTTFTAKGLGIDAIAAMVESGKVDVYGSDALSTWDSAGNKMDYLSLKISRTLPTAYPTYLNSVSVTPITPLSEYNLKISFSNYLDTQSSQEVFYNALSDYATLKLSHGTGTLICDNLQDFNQTDVSTTLKLKIDTGTLTAGDTIAIDLSALKDVFKNGVLYHRVMPIQDQIYFKFDGTTFVESPLPTASTLKLIGSKTLDTNYDGMIDRLALTFSEAVNDLSFKSDKSVALSNGAVGTLLFDGALKIDTEYSADVDNDDTVYLVVDNANIGVNTGATGSIYLQDEGLFAALADDSNLSISDETGVAMTDGSAPQLVSTKVVLGKSAEENSIELTFSEPLYTYDCCDLSISNAAMTTSAIFEVMRVGDDSTLGYDTAHPVALADTEMSKYGNSYLIKGLPSNTVDVLMKMGVALIYYPDTLKLKDQAGLYTTGTWMQAAASFTLETAKPTIESVKSVNVLTGSAYDIVLKMDQYMSYDTADATFVSNIGEYVTANTSESYVLLSGEISNDTASTVTATVHVELDTGMLYPGDMISINVADLQDVYGRNFVYLYNETPQSKIFMVYDGEDLIEMGDPETTSFDIINVSTLDFDSDGCIDYLKVKFNLPVSDMSYIYTDGYAPTISGIESVTIMETDIGTGQYDGSLDKMNDDVILVPLDRMTYDPDTGSTGSLAFSNNGWISALNGAVLQSAGKSYDIDDGASPVILGTDVRFDDVPEYNTMTIVCSETLAAPEGYGTAAEMLFEAMRIRNDSEVPLNYETAVPPDTNGSLFVDSGSNAVIHGLSRELTATILDVGYLESYFPSELAVYDAAGNPLHTREEYFYEMAVQAPPTYVYTAETVPMTTSSVYKITIPVENYMSDASEAYVASLTSNGFLTEVGFAGGVIEPLTTVTLDNETADDIAINIEINLGGALIMESDYIVVPIHYFTDIFGNVILYKDYSVTHVDMGLLYQMGEWVPFPLD